MNPFPAANVAPSHSVLPLLLAIARRPRVVFGIPLLCAVLAVIYCLFSPPVYTATARILPPQYNENTVMAMQNQLGGESQLGNSALTLKNPTDLFVGILTSRTILDAVIDATDLRNYYDEPEIGVARKALDAAISIRAGKDGIVSISVDDTDRDMAATLANAFVDQFYEFSRTLARQQAAQRTAFYGNALASAKQELAAADIELARIEKLTGFTRLDGQDEAIVRSAAELQGQIAAREVQLKTMASYATPSNPDYRLIRRELVNLRAELTELQAATATSDGARSGPFVGLGDVPDALLEHARRKRDVHYWETIVMLLGRFSELGKIDESRDISLFQVLDRAIPPHDKSKPRTRVAAVLAGLGSGFICLMWVLAAAHVSQRRAECAEFERHWQELVATVNPFGASQAAKLSSGESA
jgi:uncharacterized protein involved in exopolysaccharide biosynthesis